MKINTTIEQNRALFLNELRSGKYKKGTTRSDEKGNPIISSEEDNNGACACAIMIHLFDPGAKTSTRKAREALGLTGADCRFIQHDLNDSPLTFPQIADRIEREVFTGKASKNL